MAKKYIILILMLAIALSGCIGSTNPKSSEVQNASINSLIFTRTGIIVGLSDNIEIESAEIYDNNIKISEVNINRETNSVVIDFDWNPKKKYEIKLKNVNGNFSEMVYAPSKPSYFELWNAPLGSLENKPKIEGWSKVVYEDLEFSQNSKYIAIAGYDHIIRVFDINGKEGGLLWTYKIRDGYGKSIAFSQDSKYLFVGEASVDGYLYCFKVSNGNLKWKYRIADDVGTRVTTSPFYLPTVRDIKTVNNIAYVTGYFSEKNKITKGIIYAFNITTGELVWRYPKNELMDTKSAKIFTSENGEYVIFATMSFKYNHSKEKYKDGTLFVLSGKDGKLLWNHTFPPNNYLNFVGIWDGIDISKNGKYIAITTADGRSFLIDNIKSIKNRKIAIIWQKNISTPIEVSGIPIYGYGGMTRVTDNGSVIIQISKTYVTPSGKTKAKTPPINHPKSNSIYEFDSNGNLVWKWTAEGGIDTPSLSKNGKYLIVPIIHDYITQKKDTAGVYVFDLEQKGGATSKLSIHYLTEGIPVAVDLSPDGKYIAFISAPIDIDISEKEKIIGKHQLHLLI
ncbi:MAG TPA: hypothetical protein EYP22_07550 [Methanosarcinales archaeon]|nr:hypothetical protein [Methanosarcinales archaeon]